MKSPLGMSRVPWRQEPGRAKSARTLSGFSCKKPFGMAFTEGVINMCRFYKQNCLGGIWGVFMVLISVVSVGCWGWRRILTRLLKGEFMHPIWKLVAETVAEVMCQNCNNNKKQKWHYNARTSAVVAFVGCQTRNTSMAHWVCASRVGKKQHWNPEVLTCSGPDLPCNTM